MIGSYSPLLSISVKFICNRNLRHRYLLPIGQLSRSRNIPPVWRQSTSLLITVNNGNYRGYIDDKGKLRNDAGLNDNNQHGYRRHYSSDKLRNFHWTPFVRSINIDEIDIIDVDYKEEEEKEERERNENYLRYHLKEILARLNIKHRLSPS